MQTGFIDAADSYNDATNRKAYWEDQIKTLGFADEYHVKVHLVKGPPKANGVRYAYYAIFIEPKTI